MPTGISVIIRLVSKIINKRPVNLLLVWAWAVWYGSQGVRLHNMFIVLEMAILYYYISALVCRFLYVAHLTRIIRLSIRT